MRFGIRVLVFCFAVAPFTWVSVQKLVNEIEASSVTAWSVGLALVMCLLSLGYLVSVVESLRNAVLDAKDARDEARAAAESNAKEAS